MLRLPSLLVGVSLFSATAAETGRNWQTNVAFARGSTLDNPHKGLLMQLNCF